MFQKLFDFIAEGFCNAILRGVKKADEKLTAAIETNEPLTIEAKVTTPEPNGKPKAKRAARV